MTFKLTTYRRVIKLSGFLVAVTSQGHRDGAVDLRCRGERSVKLGNAASVLANDREVATETESALCLCDVFTRANNCGRRHRATMVNVQVSSSGSLVALILFGADRISQLISKVIGQ